MAEPQRASSPAADPARPKPRPGRPSRYAAPLRLPIDDTQDLSPPGYAPPHPPPAAGEANVHPPERSRRALRPQILRLPARSPGEWALMGVVLLGLALNASVLVTVALSPTDRALGLAVFLAGFVLLVLMALCRGGNCR